MSNLPGNPFRVDPSPANTRVATAAEVAPDPEHRADAIADAVGGQAVRYDRRAVQTLGRGTGRPRRLPR